MKAVIWFLHKINIRCRNIFSKTSNDGFNILFYLVIYSRGFTDDKSTCTMSKLYHIIGVIISICTFISVYVLYYINIAAYQQLVKYLSKSTVPDFCGRFIQKFSTQRLQVTEISEPLSEWRFEAPFGLSILNKNWRISDKK